MENETPFPHLGLFVILALACQPKSTYRSFLKLKFAFLFSRVATIQPASKRNF